MSESRTQLENILELLLAEENDKVEEMLHEYVVAKARAEYEKVLDEDVSEEETVEEAEESEEEAVEETEEEVKKKSEVNEEIVLMDLKPSNYTKLKKELEKIEKKVGFSTMEDGDTSLFITNIKDQNKTVKAIEDTLKKLRIKEPKDVDFRRKA